MDADNADAEYTLPEVAILTHVQTATVRSWVERGLLPAHAGPDGEPRVPRAELEAFVERHGMPPIGQLGAAIAGYRELMNVLPPAAREQFLADLERRRLPGGRGPLTEPGGRTVGLHDELFRQGPHPRVLDNPAWRTVDEYEDQGHGIVQVGLERLPCFGECPAYTAVIHADGRAEYEGFMHVPRLGIHRGKAYVYDFQRLAQFIAGTRFWEMEDGYDFRNAVVSDAPGSFVLVATTERCKVVSNYADAGPPELWAIAGLIDLLLSRTEWE